MLFHLLIPVVAILAVGNGETIKSTINHKAEEMTESAMENDSEDVAKEKYAERVVVLNAIKALGKTGDISAAPGAHHQLTALDYGLLGKVEQAEYFNDYISRYAFWTSQDNANSILKQNTKVIDVGFDGDGAVPSYPDCSDCKTDSRYRTLDGKCNNVKYCLYGSSGSTMRRLIPASYGEDNSPREGDDTPGVLAFKKFSITRGKDARIPSANKLSQFAMTFGQYLAHDITASPRRSVFNEDKKSLEVICKDLEVDFEDCFDIVHRKRIMNFIRTAPGLIDVENSYRFGQREQINQQSAFLDNSNLYGLSDDVLDNIVDKETGKFKLEAIETFGDFPIRGDGQYCEVAKVGDTEANCFESGDGKMNIQLGVMLTHIAVAKEHNHIVEKLLVVDSSLDGNRKKLFEEARRIVNAITQSITYNQYLPLIIGAKMVGDYNIKPKEGTQYDSSLDPGVVNSFATAAFRFGHSSIDNEVKMANLDGKLTNKASLRQTIFKTEKIFKSKNNPRRYLMGLVLDVSEEVDTTFASVVAVSMFASSTPNEPSHLKKGISLPALNIQRGRDHGIPDCGAWMDFIKSQTGEEIEGINDDAQRAKDLYYCGLEEDHVTGGEVGSMFAHIIAYQFLNTMNGDRYFYSHSNSPSPFTAEARAEIEKATPSQLICRHIETNAMRSARMRLPIDSFVVGAQEDLLDCATILMDAPDIATIYNKGQ